MKAKLKKKGYGGLYVPGECGCTLDDLAPCGECRHENDEDYINWMTEEQRAENRWRSLIAEESAKKVLKPGDRLRVTKCPGTKRWITFAEWDGHWIVSKSGINDYSPLCVDMLNGEAVDFTKTPNTQVQRP